MDKNKDIFGKAIAGYYKEKDETPITVHSPDFENDEIPVAYLFRGFEEMPKLEQEALKLCEGSILDVGCGAGSHALYLQNERKLEVKAIDTSSGAIEIAKERGLNNAVVQDFYKISSERFDSILMLMNGTGIIGKLDNINDFLQHCHELLNDNGQLILDSSDLIYLFDDEFIDSEEYYGELTYELSYKGETSDPFDWLYVDKEILQKAANNNNFSCEIVFEGEHYDYLAILKKV
ncbi:bifunctional 2-polyprenyl-6-hydroxyphenol methylase/3-demethylubiquinol 3-O-methyltransferase UbiG [uncultured Christiangramia sp.]|uniref:class I SAM-dependent methyltransferase n=1 Tax=uncultured Christiangramia sp. TaxID=503836 RepID=UPI00262A5504|nr:class I SAM-dependent methyltransferase [uncultured Christiangramia sp.]